MKELNHVIDFDNVEILDSASSDYRLRLRLLLCSYNRLITLRMTTMFVETSDEFLSEKQELLFFFIYLTFIFNHFYSIFEDFKKYLKKLIENKVIK